MKRKVLMLVVVLGLLVAGGAAAAVGITVANKVSAASSAVAATKGGNGWGWEAGVDNESLASALGITSEELTAAQTAAHEKAIDKAVELGLITETQAEDLKSDTNFGMRGLQGLISQDDLAQIDTQALLAEELGISTDELTAAVTSAKQAELDAMVAEGTLTQEEADLIAAQQALGASTSFGDDVKAGIKTALENAVAAGTITQAQYEAIWAKVESANFGNFLPGFGRGMPGMMGEGRMGRFGGMMGGGHGRGGFGNGPDTDDDAGTDTGN